MNLASMLDRPIAFQRSFVHLGAGITGALMLSQAVYWANRGSDDDGWFFKTQVEWEDETGLSRTEQETARKKLLSLGLMEEARRGIPAKLYFRVSIDALVGQLEGLDTPCKQDCRNPAIKDAGTPQTGSQKTRKQVRRKAANRSAGNPQSKLSKTTTETTSETTAESIAKGAEAPHAAAEPMRVTAPNGTIHEIPAELRYPGPDTKSHKTWIAYAIAYEGRYHSWPVWNQTVGGQICNFIDRVGAEVAPRIAVHYVRRVQEDFIVREMHPVRLLQQNAEKWATQCQTGVAMTSTQARQADQTSANAGAIEEAKRLMRERAGAAQGEATSSGQGQGEVIDV